MMCLGQFKATAAANPTLGTKGMFETVEEDRVEVLINDKGDVNKAIEELKKVGLRDCTWLVGRQCSVHRCIRTKSRLMTFIA